MNTSNWVLPTRGEETLDGVPDVSNVTVVPGEQADAAAPLLIVLLFLRSRAVMHNKCMTAPLALLLLLLAAGLRAERTEVGPAVCHPDCTKYG